MPQFDPTTFTPQIFWLLVSFGVLFVVMTGFLVPRLAKVIETREARLREDKERADQLFAEAESLKNEAEARLEQARARAREHLHTTMTDLQHQKVEQLRHLQDQSATKLGSFYEDILKERKAFTKILTETVCQSIQSIAPQVFGKKVTNADILPHVQKAVKEHVS